MLKPWVPLYGNQGHECLVAEVNPGMPPASGVLDDNLDPRVAQHNLSVVMISEASFHFAFEVRNAERKAQFFTVQAREAPYEQLVTVVRLFGAHSGSLNKGSISALGLTGSPCPDIHDLQKAAPPTIRLELGPYGSTGYSVVGELEGGSALVHITQAVEECPLGGLSVLILRKEEK